MAASAQKESNIPEGCVAHAVFEKRQYSKLSTSKMSTKRAVRAGVRFGAVIGVGF
jgi:hypothetical protein